MDDTRAALEAAIPMPADTFSHRIQLSVLLDTFDRIASGLHGLGLSTKQLTERLEGFREMQDNTQCGIPVQDAESPGLEVRRAKS